jgi:glycine hydroxymethyltransferase
VDLRPKNFTGKAAEQLLDRAGITVNKNTIPGDPQSPFVTSGIRVGTPAVTTRGLGEAEMELVAGLMDRVLAARDDGTVARVRADVRALSEAFPLYAGRPAAVAAIHGG